MTPVLPASTDFAIIGGGMVGLSLALLLARQLPSREITLIEAIPLHSLASGGELPPSFDARSTALAESSRGIFQAIGLWDALFPGLCAIDSIQVADRGHPGSTRLHAHDSALPALGYVVENRHLGRALMAAVSAMANIRIIAPARVTALTPVAGGMVIAVDSERCQATLAVVADGANSALLQGLGIHSECRDYQRTALIANIALEKPHGHVAYERFTDEGPIALLPLQDANGEHRAALVWTLTAERAESLAAATAADFLAELHQRFGFRAGRFLRSGERSSYPLKLMVAEEQIRSNLAVVGNAAHFLHPVAGQGFNLALRDVARLAEIVATAVAKGEALGSLPVLERFVAAQGKDQRATIAFSDSLPSIFAQGEFASILVRNAGLVALDLIPAARREFARFGAGLAGAAVKFHG